MSDTDLLTQSRRRFLERILAVSVFSAVPPSTLLGTTRTRILTDNGKLYGRFQINLGDSNYAVLRNVAGSVKIMDVAGQGLNIVVTRTATDTFKAVDANCTHIPCELPAANSSGTIVCPCHGSQFKADGTLVKGPARRGLNTYLTFFDGNSTLEIEINGISSSPALITGAAIIGAPLMDDAASRLELNLALEAEKTVTASLVDMSGRRIPVMNARTLPAGVRRLSMDIARVASGAYMLQIESSTGVLASTRVVVKR